VGEVTEPQRSFLERAAQLHRHDMGIMPRGTMQRRMAQLLEEQGYLTYAGFGTHEETGVEDQMWRITPAGLQQLEQREGLRELTRMTEEVGGYDAERAAQATKPIGWWCKCPANRAVAATPDTCAMCGGRLQQAKRLLLARKADA
jgi:hypothetical protein